jgi:hypothetical protein
MRKVTAGWADIPIASIPIGSKQRRAGEFSRLVGGVVLRAKLLAAEVVRR